MFHVGQKVVCVDAELTQLDDKRELVNGAIYTVQAIVKRPSRAPCYNPRYKNRGGAQDLHLAEVKRYSKVPFAVERFRPIIERKTDISVFTRMLVPAGKRELVEPTGH